MALFRRRQRHEADQPAEEAAEASESASPVFGFGALPVPPVDEKIAEEEVRAAANPEDDGAQTQLIDDERRREEYGR